MASDDAGKTEDVLQEHIDEAKAKAGHDMDIQLEAAEFAPRFQEWIDSYERDIALFREIVGDEDGPESLRRLLAGGLMYAIRVIDLVPDNYRPVGTIDDTLVLRVLADLGAEHAAELTNPKAMKSLFKLANDVEVIRSFAGEDLYRALENYVRSQPETATHGLTGESVVKDSQARQELFRQVDAELKSFQAVAIDDGPRAERELKSYLRTKLAK